MSNSWKKWISQMAKRYNFSYDGKPYGYVVFENGELIDMQFYDPQHM